MLALVAERRRFEVSDGAVRVDPQIARAAAAGRHIGLERGLAVWRELDDDTGVGLELAQRAPFAAFHYLGTAVASAPHLLGALQVFCRHAGYLLQPTPLQGHLAGGRYVIGWDDPAPDTPRALRDFVLGLIIELLRAFPVDPVRPYAVELADARATRFVPYLEGFACPVTFGHTRTRIRIRAEELPVPLFGANAPLHTAMLHRISGFDHGERSTGGQVVGALEYLLDQGDPRIESVSRLLGASPRALQKRLALEGQRYSALLQQVRQRRALQMLVETRMPLHRIALSLGYASSTSFTRAFTEWFGRSPSGIREQAERPWRDGVASESDP